MHNKSRLKRIGMLVLAVLFVWSGTPTAGAIGEEVGSVTIQTVNENDFTYEDHGDGTATITGYTGNETEIDIPSELNGLTVTHIRYEAFRNKGLTRVTFPNSLESIGNSAFVDNRLEKIEIPESVLVIEAHAFQNNALTEVYFAEGLISIRSAAFGRNELTEIQIPSTVEYIGSSAFSVNKLTNVHIPKSVKDIGVAFIFNPLEQITVDEENEFYKDIDRKGLYTIDGKTLIQGTISGNIQPGTEEIGYGAFWGMGLTEVHITDGVKTIGKQSFQENAINKLSLPNSLEEIGDFAFQNNQLSKIVVPESVKSIKWGAFGGNLLTDAIIYGNPTFGDDVFWEPFSEPVLWGYAGTTVEAYANNNNYTFKPLNDTFAGGLGTEEYPYIIRKPEQLDAVRDYLDAHFKLGADIDLSSYRSGEGWVPIADEYDPLYNRTSFSGSFDGNGFAINGLTIKRDHDYQGLFASIGETGVVRNVSLEGVSIQGRNNVGGLAGMNLGEIENCSVNGDSIKGGIRTGGLVGHNYGAAITASFATTQVSGDSGVGGLVGTYNGSHDITKKISHSYASGEVTGNVGVGGLIGSNETANSGSNEIINSYATGKVTGKNQAGGLVGANFSYPGGVIRIKDSYATGKVEGQSQVGGLIGYNRTTYASATIEVINAYVTNEVTGTTHVGGLIGQNSPSVDSTIDTRSSYWNTSVYTGGPPDNGLGTPKTATGLMERASFVDWDFDHVWYQYDELTMPFLQWQNPIVLWDVSIADDTLQIDETTEITVSTTHKNNDMYNATAMARYMVDQPDIVTVTNGTVIANKSGKATITVSLFDDSRTLEISVLHDGIKPKPPNITLDPEGWTNADEVHVTIEHESKGEGLSEVQTIRVKVGDADWQDYVYDDIPISWKVTTEGETLIQAQAIDKAGYESDIAERTVKISRSGLMIEPKLYFSDHDQQTYASGAWTNRSVTAEVYAWNARGVTVTSIVYSLDEGATWGNYDEPLTFSEEGNHSLWFKVEDEANNELTDQLRIRIDRTAPEIRFAPNGNERASSTGSTQVTIDDHASGIADATLRYVWSTSTALLDEQADWKLFRNGDTLNHKGENGNWYLHIRARDLAENEGYAVSKRFQIQVNAPVDNDNGSNGTEIHVGSNNAMLGELILSEGQLTPAFSEDITEYQALVAYEVENFTVTVKTAHHYATIKINGEAIKNGQESYSFSLVEGSNIIEILVIAENGARKTYTLMIEREKGKPEESEIPQRSFTDTAGHWAEHLIKDAVQKRFISGYPDGTFKPDHSISRVELTVIIARALKLKDEGTQSFADSNQIGSWATQAVALAAQAGIVTGYEDGNFYPNKEITRVEMAVMISRALQLKLDVNSVTDFIDDIDIPQWAKGAVEALHKLGIVNGRGGSKFVPNESVTRAEAIVLLLRMLEVQDQ